MKETFEEYLQRLKDRRTEDNYMYTDEDFIQYEEYIRDCCTTNLSVYNCLEFMSFAEREIKLEDVFNDEKKEKLKQFIKENKQETLVQIDQNNPVTRGSTALVYKQETLEEAAEREYPTIHEQYQYDAFIEGAKWQMKRSYSEEEVNSIFYAICKHSFFEDNVETVYLQDVKDEFEQFKNN